MNKQEFQQKIKDMKPPKFFNAVTLREAYEAGFEEAKGNALCDSCFLNEQKKPVVPKYVAEWYEKNKDGLEWNLYTFCVDFYKRELRDDLHNWFKYGDNKPIETLVKMKLFGYEVEKEKLYTVELPNPNGDSNRYGLCKVDGRIIIGSFVFGLNKAINTKLTEAEIKKDFAWAWEFAEEV